MQVYILSVLKVVPGWVSLDFLVKLKLMLVAGQFASILCYFKHDRILKTTVNQVVLFKILELFY